MAGIEREVVVIGSNSKSPIRKYSIVTLHRNNKMMKDLCAVLDVPSDVISILDENKPYKLKVFRNGNKEYHDLSNIFRGKSKEWFNYSKFSMEYVHMVFNPYLTAQYYLKNLRKKELYGLCKDTMLFHGTRLQDVTSICKENFNWRLVKTHLFGKGISFAKFAKYASYYPQNGDNELRVIILSMVSYTRKCEGEENMVVPPFEGYDTTVKHNEDVWVKFEDAEFLPSCVFYYKSKTNTGDGEDVVSNITNIFEKFEVNIDDMFDNTIIDDNHPNIVVIK